MYLRTVSQLLSLLGILILLFSTPSTFAAVSFEDFETIREIGFRQFTVYNNGLRTEYIGGEILNTGHQNVAMSGQHAWTLQSMQEANMLFDPPVKKVIVFVKGVHLDQPLVVTSKDSQGNVISAHHIIDSNNWEQLVFQSKVPIKKLTYLNHSSQIAVIDDISTIFNLSKLDHKGKKSVFVDGSNINSIIENLLVNSNTQNSDYCTASETSQDGSSVSVSCSAFAVSESNINNTNTDENELASYINSDSCTESNTSTNGNSVSVSCSSSSISNSGIEGNGDSITEEIFQNIINNNNNQEVSNITGIEAGNINSDYCSESSMATDGSSVSVSCSASASSNDTSTVATNNTNNALSNVFNTTQAGSLNVYFIVFLLTSIFIKARSTEFLKANDIKNITS